MEKYLTFIKKLHRRVLTQEFDRIIPVLADEGRGKSTLMVETIYHYESEIKDRDMTADDVLDHVVWSDADELRDKMVNLPRGSCIAVMDAARLLNRKEAMKDEQKELEKDLFDSRAFGHLLLLGFQSPRSVPEDLGNRRAKNLVRLPARGRLEGYSRASMDDWDWQDTSNLPDPDLRDSFPSLDGTDLWDAFREADLEKKEERITPPDEEDDTPPEQYAVAEAVKDDLAYHVSKNHSTGELYVDSDMISLEHSLSEKKATQVRKHLERDDDVTIEPYRVLLNGNVVKEVDPPDESGGSSQNDPESEDWTVETVISDIKQRGMKDYISQHGQTKRPYIDASLIEMDYGLSARKSKNVKKALEREHHLDLADEEILVEQR